MNEQELNDFIIRESFKYKLMLEEIAELKKQNRFQFENLRFMIKGLAYSMILLGVGIILTDMIHLTAGK